MTTSFTEFPLKVKMKVKLLSPVPLFVTPGTVAYQAPLSMEFSRQEYWSGLPLPSLQLFTNSMLLAVDFS